MVGYVSGKLHVNFWNQQPKFFYGVFKKKKMVSSKKKKKKNGVFKK